MEEKDNFKQATRNQKHIFIKQIIQKEFLRKVSESPNVGQHKANERIQIGSLWLKIRVGSIQDWAAR